MSTTKPEVHNSGKTPALEQAALTTQPMTATWQLRRAHGFFAFYQNCVSALRALRTNKLRSLLTSLGIIIGVGAVIVMISTSEGNAAVINQRLSTLSPNELIIRPGSASTGGISQGAGSRQSLTIADADSIAAQVQNVAAVSPVISVGGQIVFRNQNWSSSVQGVYPAFQQINNWQVQEGSFVTQTDEQSDRSVAVIGQTVADNLFTPLGIDPIGQQIRIGNVAFTVTGVLTAKGATGAFDTDDVVYIPFSTAQQRLIGGQYAGSIDVLVDSSDNVGNVQASVQQLLEQRHGITDSSQDDFVIQNQDQILQTAQSISQSLTILLVSVAAISLLVGGIGIMNIMLVSVTERTREIGIRMAIGARAQDIMTQFLIEAGMLSALGGLIGIALGILGALIVASLSARPFVLDLLSVLLAFSFAAAVGLIFGFYPAQRASRLDPIVALRTE